MQEVLSRLDESEKSAGFKTLTQVPEVVYVLELSLANTKADGRYHRLKVNRDVNLEARRGRDRNALGWQCMSMVILGWRLETMQK